MNTRQVSKIPLLLILVLASSCKSKMPAEEAYTPAPGAVGFDIQLESGPANLEQTTIWLCSFQSPGHVATFRMELSPDQNNNSSVSISFGKGKFLPVAGSDASVLLTQLKTALEAKTIPQGVKRASSAPFTYAVLGREMRREKDGSLSVEKPGNWMAIKLFLRDGEPEVFLNLNPMMRKAEFSMKDPDYGDDVVSELAKVL